MSSLDIRSVTAADHTAWLALWQAYLRFYESELPTEITTNTWERFLDPAEPTHAALAWSGEHAVGLVQWVFHRSNWLIAVTCRICSFAPRCAAVGWAASCSNMCTARHVKREACACTG